MSDSRPRDQQGGTSSRNRPGLILRLGLLFFRLGLLLWVVAVSVGASRPLMGVVEITASRSTALISSAHSCGHDENDKDDGHGNHDDDNRRVAHCCLFSGHILGREDTDLLVADTAKTVDDEQLTSTRPLPPRSRGAVDGRGRRGAPSRLLALDRRAVAGRGRRRRRTSRARASRRSTPPSTLAGVASRK